jgi:hypothetical protein
MNISDFLPFIAMGGVGVLFVLRRHDAHGARLIGRNRRSLLALVVAVFGACCLAGAGTALQIARIGLAGTPPPSAFGTIGRLIGVAVAIALWPLAGRHIERATIFTFVVGAGASGLIGLGLRSGVLDAARAICHLLMFACGAVLAGGFGAGLANWRAVFWRALSLL